MLETSQKPAHYPSTSTFDVRDIAVVDKGESEIALVLIHGFTCSLEDWRHQVDALSKKYRCVALDLPGHGATPRTAEATIEAQAWAVNAVRNRLGLDNVILVGHSLGCRVASESYAQMPSGVRGIVYIDGRLSPSADPEATIAKVQQRIDEIGAQPWIDHLYLELVHTGTPPETKKFILDRKDHLDLPFAIDLHKNFHRWESTKALSILPTIHVPVLVIQATSSTPNGKRRSIEPGERTPWIKAVEGSVADHEVVRIGGHGHFVMLEAPEETSQAIRGFADRVVFSSAEAKS